MDSLEKSLLENYGWNSFKPGQRSVIQAIISGKDSIVVLPTGGGKSLCYQLPALIRRGLVVVISPLIALMEDQVKQLSRRNIASICFHRDLDSDRKNEAIDFLKDTKKNLRLLYLSPERFLNKSIQTFLFKKAKAKEIVAFAIDEAHCISSWGYDFRPDYRRLGSIRDLYPDVPIIALSATAPPKVRADMITLLRLHNPFIQVCSARRKNLNYSCQRRPKNPLPMILEELQQSRGASLIYVRTRKAVHYWTDLLQKSGVPSLPYHAGLNSTERDEALTTFLCQPNPVLVATVAFGMGVDRADVGLVLHLDLPANPEKYLQESGRAGRDGLPAKCLVLFSPVDRIKLGWAIRADRKISKNYLSERELICRNELIQEQMRLMEEVLEGERCIEKSLLLAVGEIVTPCGTCDKCKKNQIHLKTENFTKKISILLKEIKINQDVVISRLTSKLAYQKETKRNFWRMLTIKLIKEDLIGETNDGKQTLFLKESGLRYLRNPWPIYYQKIS